MLSRWPAATFYMLQTRAWELLLGVLVAKYEPLRGRSRFVSEAVGTLGLTMIVGSMFVLIRDMPFPGARAIPPCVGSAMIIAAGVDRSAAISRFLAWRPLVLVGLISYSLYLFHWPTIVLSREAFGLDTDKSSVRFGILLVTFAVAWLSWRFVEGPFRRKPAEYRVVFTAVGFAVMGGLSIAAALKFSSGFPQRFSARTNEIASFIDSGDTHFGSTKCGPRRDWMEVCLRDDAGKPSVLVLGDSYSAHLWFGLNKSYSRVNFKQAALSSCSPLIDVQGYGKAPCASFMSSMFRNNVINHPDDLVILAAQWSTPELPKISETLDYLNSKGIKVVLVGPPPQYKSSLPQLLAIANERGDPGLVGRNRRPEIRSLDNELETLAHEKGVQYVSLYQYFCTPECSTVTPGGDTASIRYWSFNR